MDKHTSKLLVAVGLQQRRSSGPTATNGVTNGQTSASSSSEARQATSDADDVRQPLLWQGALEDTAADGSVGINGDLDSLQALAGKAASAALKAQEAEQQGQASDCQPAGKDNLSGERSREAAGLCASAVAVLLSPADAAQLSWKCIKPLARPSVLSTALTHPPVSIQRLKGARMQVPHAGLPATRVERRTA